MNTATFLWSGVPPFLILCWVFQRVARLEGFSGLLVAVGGAAGAVLFPWFGHSLPYWTSGLSANFSVVLALLLAAGIGERALGRSLLGAAGWRAAWLFGGLAVLVLYLSALGWGRQLDVYAFGWPWLFRGSSLLLFGGIGAAAAILLWRANRFGLILLAGLLGYASRFQESDNLWDYLVDPLYGTASLLALLWLAWRRGKSRQQ